MPARDILRMYRGDGPGKFQRPSADRQAWTAPSIPGQTCWESAFEPVVDWR